MIARGAEANPSCFRAQSLQSPSPSTSTSSTTVPPIDAAETSDALPTATGTPPTDASAPRASAAAEKEATLVPHLADPITEIIPRLLRISFATANAWGNTKYIIQSLSLTTTSHEFSKRSKAERNEFKQLMTRAKSLEDACRAVKMSEEEIEEARRATVASLVPLWDARRLENEM